MSKFIPLKERIIRAGIHLIVGVIVFEFLYQGFPLAAIIGSLGFFWYERNEEKWLADRAFYDIIGALIGFLGWGSIRILLRYL